MRFLSRNAQVRDPIHAAVGLWDNMIKVGEARPSKYVPETARAFFGLVA
jgi:hypothetical protein